MTLATSILGVVIAFAIKQPCVHQVTINESPYPRYCYSEIRAFFITPGIAQGLAYRDYPLEYPVVTGTFIEATGAALEGISRTDLMSFDAEDYFRVSAVALVPFSLATALLLHMMTPRRRVLLWTLGPPTLLYSFHNWDLIALAAVTIALWALERKRDYGAGTAIAVGVGAKAFPLVLLAGALPTRWTSRDSDGARKLLMSFVGVFAIINLPWILVSPDGWLGTWSFHARRDPGRLTVWDLLLRRIPGLIPESWSSPEAFRTFVDVTTLLLLIGALAFYLVVGLRRARMNSEFPGAATAMGLLATLLLISKVQSPPYALWLVPFIVLLDVPGAIVALYFAAATGVFVAFLGWESLFSAAPPDWARDGVVILRSFSLLAVAWWATRAKRTTVLPRKTTGLENCG
jgi:uncharacterized membrane protein